MEFFTGTDEPVLKETVNNFFLEFALEFCSHEEAEVDMNVEVPCAGRGVWSGEIFNKKKKETRAPGAATGGALHLKPEAFVLLCSEDVLGKQPTTGVLRPKAQAHPQDCPKHPLLQRRLKKNGAQQTCRFKGCV